MKPIETMRLMSVRPAKFQSTSTSTVPYLTTDEFEQLSPAQITILETTEPLLYFQLKSQVKDGKILLSLGKEKALSFEESGYYTASTYSLTDNMKTLMGLHAIMKSVEEGTTTAGLIAQMETLVGDTLADYLDSTLEARLRYWDNLFARNITGNNSEGLEVLITALKTFFYVKEVKDNASNPEFSPYTTARIIERTRIKVHYSLDMPLPEETDTEPAPPPEEDEFLEIVESMNKISEFLFKLKNQHDTKMLRYRKLIGNLSEGSPVPPEAEGFDPMLVDWSDFETEDIERLADIGIDTETGFTYDVVIKRIETNLDFYRPIIISKVKATDRMVNIGGVMVNADKLCAHIVNRNLCARYIGPTLPQGKGNVQPIGIADLKVLESTLYKYELGEIAHIENVLQGQKREKVFKELRRTEETYLSEEENTSEKIKDTQTTERFEMQKEVSTVVSEESQFDAGLSVTASYGGMVSIAASTNYASANSQQQSDTASQTYAKEITERAVDRVIKRSRTQQSITRILETEETNTHTLDNTGQPDHITGIYRWVNKVYYNKIKNYGKRLMFEVIVPEPAAFYIYSKLVGGGEKTVMQRPINPREGKLPAVPALGGFGMLTADNYSIWTALYDVQDTTPPPPQYVTVSKAIRVQKVAGPSSHADNNGTEVLDNLDFNAQAVISNDIEIPEGYVGISAIFKGMTTWQTQADMQLNIAHQWRHINPPHNLPVPLDNMTGTVPVSIIARNNHGSLNVIVQCQLSAEKLRDWKIKTFDSIMRGYNRKLAEFEAELRSVQSSEGIVIKGNNPLKNREIEKEELKKAAISIITGQRFESFDALVGADPQSTNYLYPEFHFAEAKAEGKYIQFFEQAFDWRNLTYQFYPYFWGRKTNWIEAKRLEDTDTVFEKFLQAGAARVLVPVNLGYNESVMNYVQTGTVWHGSESVVGNDDYLLSIYDELMEPIAVDESEAWLTTVPTDLVFLQPVDTDPILPDNSEDFPPLPVIQ